MAHNQVIVSSTLTPAIMIKQFSLKNDGNTYLSEHFQVKEFKCNDGSDKILIDLDLVEILETIRKYFNKPVTVMSGYRTEAYNRKVSNTQNSQHCLGTAADIKVEGMSPIAVALMCEFALMRDFGGIGLYKGQNFTHIDTREKMTRWVQLGNSSTYRVVNKISMNLGG